MSWQTHSQFFIWIYTYVHVDSIRIRILIYINHRSLCLITGYLTHITEVEATGKTWSLLSNATEECGNVRYERSDNSLVGATGSIIIKVPVCGSKKRDQMTRFGFFRISWEFICPHPSWDVNNLKATWSYMVHVSNFFDHTCNFLWQKKRGDNLFFSSTN